VFFFFGNLSKRILLFFSCISSLLLLFFRCLFFYLKILSYNFHYQNLNIHKYGFENNYVKMVITI